MERSKRRGARLQPHLHRRHGGIAEDDDGDHDAKEHERRKPGPEDVNSDVDNFFMNEKPEKSQPAHMLPVHQHQGTQGHHVPAEDW